MSHIKITFVNFNMFRFQIVSDCKNKDELIHANIVKPKAAALWCMLGWRLLIKPEEKLCLQCYSLIHVRKFQSWFCSPGHRILNGRNISLLIQVTPSVSADHNLNSAVLKQNSCKLLPRVPIASLWDDEQSFRGVIAFSRNGSPLKPWCAHRHCESCHWPVGVNRPPRLSLMS